MRCGVVNLEMGDLVLSYSVVSPGGHCPLDKKIHTSYSVIGMVSFLIDALSTWFFNQRVIHQLNPLGSIEY